MVWMFGNGQLGIVSQVYIFQLRLWKHVYIELRPFSSRIAWNVRVYDFFFTRVVFLTRAPSSRATRKNNTFANMHGGETRRPST